eukprot:COSAG04_NODE_1167_length_7984_cov_8.922384_6_plen_106_part_00
MAPGFKGKGPKKGSKHKVLTALTNSFGTAAESAERSTSTEPTPLVEAFIRVAKRHREPGYYDNPVHVADISQCVHKALKGRQGCAHGVDFCLWVRCLPAQLLEPC